MKKFFIILTTIFLVSCGGNDVGPTPPQVDNNYIPPSVEDIVQNIENENNVIENMLGEDDKAIDNADLLENNEQKDENKKLEEPEENTEFYGYGSGAINVKFDIKTMVDYEKCIISKNDFEGLKDKKGLSYDELCMPKYQFVGTILAGSPDKIEVKSCLEEKGYALQKFKKGDKTFAYNVSAGLGNICDSEAKRSYKIDYYKNGEKLDEVNKFKDILPENFIYKKGNWYYYGEKSMSSNCIASSKTEIQICYNKEKNILE